MRVAVTTHCKRFRKSVSCLDYTRKSLSEESEMIFLTRNTKTYKKKYGIYADALLRKEFDSGYLIPGNKLDDDVKCTLQERIRLFVSKLKQKHTRIELQYSIQNEKFNGICDVYIPGFEIIDLKFIGKISFKHFAQVIIYALMMIEKGDTIKQVGIYNVRNNIMYTLVLSDIERLKKLVNY